MKRASIGIAAHMGWAATAVVAVDRQRLQVLRTDRIETADPADREAREPYHVAGGIHGLERVPQPPDPPNAVKRGLAKQRRFTARAIRRLSEQLNESGYTLARAGILVSRGRPAPTFEKSIGSHTQIHIQEGLAVRDAIRIALEDAGARIREIDQKQIWELAASELPSELETAIAAAKPANGGAWRKEERTAAVAAWMALRRLC